MGDGSEFCSVYGGVAFFFAGLFNFVGRVRGSGFFF